MSDEPLYTEDRLTVLIYLLLRDDIPLSPITRALALMNAPDLLADPENEVTPHGARQWRLTNGRLAELASSLSRRVQGAA